jgi:hypothetical protein
MTAKVKNTLPGSQFFIKTRLGCSLYMLITDDTCDYSHLYLCVDLNQQRLFLKNATSLLFRNDEALNLCF